jgi:hypothetical protein
MFRYHLQLANVGSYALVLRVCDPIEAALGFRHCSCSVVGFSVEHRTL